MCLGFDSAGLFWYYCIYLWNPLHVETHWWVWYCPCLVDCDLPYIIRHKHTGKNIHRLHKKILYPIFSYIKLIHTHHTFNKCNTHIHTQGVRESEWICHLIIMVCKILANGKHTEGCNYDPIQRAHAHWQCLHFHGGWGGGQREFSRNDRKMCPSLQLMTIILCEKIVSIAFQPRSKMAPMGWWFEMGVTVGEGVTSLDGGTVKCVWGIKSHERLK